MLKNRIFKKEKFMLFIGVLLFWHILFWLFLIFVVGLSASSLLFPAISLLIIGINFFVIWPKKKLLAIILSFISLIILVCSVISGYKEDYCWKLADKTADKNIMHTELIEDERIFMGNEATNISDWLRIYLKCDKK